MKAELQQVRQFSMVAAILLQYVIDDPLPNRGTFFFFFFCDPGSNPAPSQVPSTMLVY